MGKRNLFKVGYLKSHPNYLCSMKLPVTKKMFFFLFYDNGFVCTLTLFIDWQRTLKYRQHVCPDYLYIPSNLQGFTLQKEAVFIVIDMGPTMSIYIARIYDTLFITY